MKLGIVAFQDLCDGSPDCLTRCVEHGVESMNNAVIELMEAGCDGLLFFGENCQPQKDTISIHRDLLGKHLYPLITSGRILDENLGWHDYREVGKAAKLKLFNNAGTSINNASVLTSGYGISIGHFGLNRAAIDRLMRMSDLYFGDHTLFPKMDYMSTFGIGKVLSLCAWCAKVTIHMLPVGHNAIIYKGTQPNPYTTDGSVKHTDEVVSDLNKGITKKPLGLDFFDSPSVYGS